MNSNLELRHSIGKRIHDYRIENHYTQAQFAELIDISVNFLSELENGKKGMSQDTICRLCTQFNLSADYLLFGDSTPMTSIQPEALPDCENIPSMTDSLQADCDQLIVLAQQLPPERLILLIDYLNALLKMKESF